MKIALAQMDVKLGQPQKNVKRMLEFIQEAKDQGADVIAFPEMAVGGYTVQDEYNNESFCKELMSYNKVLQEASKGIVLIYGNIYFNPLSSFRNRDGRIQKFNAAYIFQDGEYVKNITGNVISCLPKSLLPNYRFFDDSRYFTSRPDFALAAGYEIAEFYLPAKVKIKEETYKIGLTLCEDLWCKDYLYNERAINPSKFFIENGADMIFNLSASPWTYNKNKARDNALDFLYKDCKEDGLNFVPFYYVNCVGAQNTGKNIITFDGGTTTYNSKGQIYDYMIPDLRGNIEGLFVTEYEKALEAKSAIERKIENKIAEKYQAIKQGLLHVKDMIGLENPPKWVVGASGGVDSSLVIAILVDTFGADNVTIVNMPSVYNSEKTIGVFNHLAKTLSVKSFTVPITDLHNVFNLSLIDNKEPTALNEENDQARIRGLILAGIAAREGALFTCNGNKLETALGYATLYGDVSGAICPLADLTKSEVFDMAEYVNETIYGEEVIPKLLLPDELFRFKEEQICPSAELKENQVDPIKFGYHCALIEALMNYQIRSVEDIMGWYLEGTLCKNLGVSIDLIKRWNIDDPKIFIEDLRWFSNLMRKNIFKRIQSPPIIVTSKTAFGSDRRESQFPPFETKRFKELEKKILGE